MDAGNIGKLTFKLALWKQILTEKYLFNCMNYKGLLEIGHMVSVHLR